VHGVASAAVVGRFVGLGVIIAVGGASSLEHSKVSAAVVPPEASKPLSYSFQSLAAGGLYAMLLTL